MNASAAASREASDWFRPDPLAVILSPELIPEWLGWLKASDGPQVVHLKDIARIWLATNPGASIATQATFAPEPGYGRFDPQVPEMASVLCSRSQPAPPRTPRRLSRRHREVQWAVGAKRCRLPPTPPPRFPPCGAVVHPAQVSTSGSGPGFSCGSLRDATGEHLGSANLPTAPFARRAPRRSGSAILTHRLLPQRAQVRPRRGSLPSTVYKTGRPVAAVPLEGRGSPRSRYGPFRCAPPPASANRVTVIVREGHGERG